MKIVKALFLLTLLALFSSSLLFFFYQKEIERHPSTAQTAPVAFVVEEGEGAAAVAQRLEQQNLVRAAYLFRLYLLQRNLTNSLQAGVFQIPPGASVQEIAEILQHGKFDLKLTFIEGWRREEMAKYLKSKIKNQKSKVDFGEDFLRETEGMEGYLFPDTYYVPTWFTAKQLVEMMRVNFEKKLQFLLDEAAAAGEKPTALTREERVILASIVEREVRFAEDRPVVAGILIKRYDNDWPLAADATLQYALANLKFKIENLKLADMDFWPKRITAKDLELDSPYNTRRYRGLPPTPISSPGLAALRATFFPEVSPYWFYLSDKEGRMHYARTIEDHSRNVAQYLAE